MPRESAAAASFCGEGVLSVVVALQTRRSKFDRCIVVVGDEQEAAEANAESSAAVALFAMAGARIDRGGARGDAVAPQRGMEMELLSDIVERERLFEESERELREKEKEKN